MAVGRWVVARLDVVKVVVPGRRRRSAPIAGDVVALLHRPSSGTSTCRRSADAGFAWRAWNDTRPARRCRSSTALTAARSSGGAASSMRWPSGVPVRHRSEDVETDEQGDDRIERPPVADQRCRRAHLSMSRRRSAGACRRPPRQSNGGAGRRARAPPTARLINVAASTAPGRSRSAPSSTGSSMWIDVHRIAAAATKIIVPSIAEDRYRPCRGQWPRSAGLAASRTATSPRRRRRG